MRQRGRRMIMGALACTAAVGLVPALAACGDDGDDEVGAVTSQAGSVASEATDAVTPDEGTDTGTSTAAGTTTIEIPADPTQLKFAKDTAEAPPGTVVLRMPNPSQIPHNIALDDPVNKEGEVVGNGGVSEVEADLEAGTYTYYCSVPGHRQAGMEGTLTVR